MSVDDKTFIRCFFESKTHREMARKLDITESAVSQRVKKLRKKLGEEVLPVKRRAKRKWNYEYLDELTRFAEECKEKYGNHEGDETYDFFSESPRWIEITGGEEE
tara:strand:- start:144 stop:458 length:315 start_codon:yes stop_codon:yes gene_type:complete